MLAQNYGSTATGRPLGARLSFWRDSRTGWRGRRAVTVLCALAALCARPSRAVYPGDFPHKGNITQVIHVQGSLHHILREAV